MLALVFITCTERTDRVTRYVNATGGLRMRESPDLNSKRILTIPDSSPIEIIEAQSEAITIDGKEGRWTKVKFKTTEGWVFGAYLADRPQSANVKDLTIPSRFQGKYIEAVKCRLGYETELYARPAALICLSGETGVVISACVPTALRIQENGLEVDCRQDTDADTLRKLLGADTPFQLDGTGIYSPTTYQITKITENRIKATCSHDSLTEFVIDSVGQPPCPQEIDPNFP